MLVNRDDSLIGSCWTVHLTSCQRFHVEGRLVSLLTPRNKGWEGDRKQRREIEEDYAEEGKEVVHKKEVSLPSTLSSLPILGIAIAVATAVTIGIVRWRSMR